MTNIEHWVKLDIEVGHDLVVLLIKCYLESKGFKVHQIHAPHADHGHYLNAKAEVHDKVSKIERG